MRMLVLSLVSCIAIPSLTLASVEPYAGKKLVEYGWDCPDTAFVRQNIQKMEKIGFDGVVMRVFAAPGKADQLGWRTFSKVRIEPEEYQHAIADLKATKFERFTDNFIQVIAQPGDVDWFDPEWSSVAYNAACLARIAKEGGCKGIMFDPEDYGTYHIWDYRQFPEEQRSAHTYEEYTAKVKERGREFIRAINREFPDLTILTLYGHSLPYIQSPTGDLENGAYGLMVAFYDGICEAASPGTILVDGFEQSYGYRGREAFQRGRRDVLVHAKTLSTSPEAFAKYVRAGFGIWSDFNSGKFGWHPDDFSKNYFAPDELRASLAYALESSDAYVWVYSERLRWWDFNVPEPYVSALALAKTGPGPVLKERRDFQPPPPKAAEQEGYSDEETFAEFRETMTEVFDFPKDGWRFARDESNSGEKEGWCKADFDDSGWRTISIGKFWEESAAADENYDGCAWYRRKFAAPAVEAGKTIFLVVGAADESASVWLNDEFVGTHEMGEAGWLVPFALDVTGTLKPGEDNVLAVRVYDRMYAGGLWKSIKLMAK